eukprot:COSAG02_NODE_9391_length_2232_cov_5.085326_1_plen_353_part_10
MGCAIVFPPFLESCRDHIIASGLAIGDFDSFSEMCLSVDARDLVEYVAELRSRGCDINLDSAVTPTGGHRRTQDLSGTIFRTTSEACRWDQIDDWARDVDTICCDGNACPAGQRPSSCSAGCAVALHAFMSACGAAVELALGAADARTLDIQAFEEDCLASADPDFFLRAIAEATCPATDDSDCGNGVVDVRETCDDGNQISDDGCDSHCQQEQGFTCSRPGQACVDIDECVQSNVCTHAGQVCRNIAGDYVCLCEPGFMEEAGLCTPCTQAHLQTGVCSDGPSCNAIKLSDPSKPDGVYYITPSGYETNPIAVTCDMTTDNGGWTLVYKIAGASTMMTTDAFEPELLASPDA